MPAAQRRQLSPPPEARMPSLRVVPKSKEPKVKASADEYARQYAACRSLGHQWQHVGFAAPEVHRPLGQYNAVGYVSVCSCGTQRTKWMGRYGSLGTTTYRYPDHYQRHGDDALSATEWRRTWIVTLLGDDA